MGNFFGGIGYVFNLIFMQPIFNALMILYHLFGDLALSIVVLTLIVKLVLFPLTLKQLKSMKANQVLQPQMQEIRKKYAKDQQAQMQAMQALYKEYKVNPLSGCLPMFVQLPVLYGLYYALHNVIGANLKYINSLLYGFVPQFETALNTNFTWFHWLSFLNPLLHINLPWVISLAAADPSHVLPVIAALATFVQLRMSQPKATTTDGKPAAPDPTQQSMKMMQYIMPIFTLFIAWNFAAGIALYWTVSSIFQAVQQYFVTGWGSLLTAPNLKGGATSPASNGKTTVVDALPARSASKAKTVVDADDEGEENESGPVGSNLRSTSHSAPRPAGTNVYQAPRRSRGSSSASARRRGSAQRSRR